MKLLPVFLLLLPITAFCQLSEKPFKRANQIVVLTNQQDEEQIKQVTRTLAQEGYQITYSDVETGVVSAAKGIKGYSVLLTISVEEDRLLLTGNLELPTLGTTVKHPAEVRARSDYRTKAFMEMMRVAELLNGFQVLYAQK